MGRLWRARRAEVEDVTAAGALRRKGLARGQCQAARVARMLRDFCERNPGLNEETAEDAFVGQLVREERKGKRVRMFGTVLSYMEVARKYRIAPSTLDEADSTIRRAAVVGGLATEARKEARPIRYRVLDWKLYVWPIIDAEGDALYRTGLYLTLATGCRAEHLNRIREIAITENGMAILWGDRKIRERRNSFLTYCFSWSCRPAPFMLPWLADWARRHWRLTWTIDDKYVTANRLNAFITARLRGKVAGLTTSFMRRRMSTLLLLLEGGHMTKAEFEDLMDHRLGTGRSKYRLEGDALSLLIDEEVLN